MTTPGEPPVSGEQPSGSGNGLPPHLNPRRTGPPPRVTNAYRQAARGGPAPKKAPKTVLGPGMTELPTGPPRRRQGGRRVARVLSWIALSLSVIIFIGAGGLYLAFNHYVGNISRVGLGPGVDAPRPAKATDKAENFLLVGSDSRDGDNGDGTQGTGATFVTGQRSDTVILVHLFGNSSKAELLSFPRDSWVQIPKYTDPKTHKVTLAHYNKLNSAFSEGGPTLLRATIEQLTDIRVDHFLQVDFSGFKGMVNALGGVNVCLTKAAKDHYSGIDLPAGESHISGDVALAFVRQRHGLPNGDIDRIARQQQFIGALTRKVLSGSTLTNPLKLNSFLNVATHSLTADESLSGGDIRKLALRLKGFNSGGVAFTTVPVADIGGRRDGQSVVLLDDAKMAAVFTSLRNDQPPGALGQPGKKPTTPAVKLIVPASGVRVAVYNGSGVQGIGRKAATDLAAVGFQIVGIPTNRGSAATITTIYYGPTKLDSAHTLQAAIPGSVIKADPTLTRSLDLVVGSGYTGAKAVTVTPTKTSTPATGTLASPAVKTASDSSCTA